MRRITRRSIVSAALAATLVALASPAQAAVTVQALWNMDKLPTMVDSAGGDNNGSTRDIVLSGSAYQFNGKSAYASVPDKANLDPGSASIRLSARISITQVPTTGQTFDIVRKGLVTTSGGYYKMEIRRSSTGTAIAACRFKDSSGRTGDAYGTASLAGRGWVVITCSKSSAGVEVSAAGSTTRVAKPLGSISNAAPVYIGTKGDGTDWFPGLMDYVKIETA